MNKAVLPAIVALGVIGGCIGGVAYGSAPQGKIQDRFPMVADAGTSNLQYYAQADIGGRKPQNGNGENCEWATPRCGFPPPPRPFPPLFSGQPQMPPPPLPGHAPPPRNPQAMPPPPAQEPPAGPLALALVLSAQETALGIRTEQLDAWRAYADAVQDAAAPANLQPPAKPEPFAVTGALAQQAVADGRKGQALLDARDALKAKLTPAQLEKAMRLDKDWQGLEPEVGTEPQARTGARP